MAERNQLALPNEDGGAGEPPLVPARVESVPGPRWTMNSRVKDVLLDGAPPSNEVPLKQCLERVGCDERVANGNVRMDVVIQEPEFYIPDEHTRRRILSLPECQTYALVYKVVPLLRGEGITSVGQWGGADENADAKRAVKDGLADKRLWNTVCGLLDSALNAVNDAEERERRREEERIESGIKQVTLVEGLYNSVMDATWAYVKSGDTDGPLGMGVCEGNVSEKVIGPGMLWKEEEVNFFNTQDNEVDEQRDREDGIEIFVLSSRMGWPYMVYSGDEQASTTLPKEFYCGVFVRREVVRVWYIVKKYLDVMHGEATGKTTHRLTLIGSPGIGKSFSVGSFLLYMLLRYDPNRLHIVAWFIGDVVYVFLKNEQPGKVLKFDYQKAAERYIEERVKTGSRVYVIYDVGKKGASPDSNWRLNWPGILITSPNKSNYKGWSNADGAGTVYINCYHVREIKAIHVWMEHFAQSNPTVSEVEDSWTELSDRIDVVGPMIRYVLFDASYFSRVKEINSELMELNDDMMKLYEKVFDKKDAWRESKSSHKLVKSVRVHYEGCDEDFRNKGVSDKVYKKLSRMVIERKETEGRLQQLLQVVVSNYGRDSAHLFETFMVCLFLQKELFEQVPRDLVKLRESEGMELLECDSVVCRNGGAELYPKELAFIDKGDNRKLKCGVLYVPRDSCFPVLDAFFVVEGEPRTVVALQATIAKQHHTTVSKVVLLKKGLAKCFCDWNIFTDGLRWEMIYVQPAGGNTIKTKQLCRNAKATEEATLTFWKSVEQYQVSLEPASYSGEQAAAHVTELTQAFGEVKIEKKIKKDEQKP
ncbi:putative retrotransposon hot spot protein 4 (RHS4) [Trypanosoma vivax]|uniref:Retrotransposon hot spot (RHS) protein, putative n=1 Tax=Trypanosoma vivax (strain Y486) TaxID=1055687 RepID=F9WUG9_TRYVY|nr:putative retrotransposon hot spot protein 4 (RHS4) [Trypanosoma vivax]KAH8619568.1 putative retrotransposon hot spot protein 4 (RHS4) [Trypanosoma vivax]CCD21218.1 retrotransposon hot spot (RHS) protein, putative [Trypanosoma vivax Y486]|eukprot:CCD21218.1 retrotransposon hot spot (RHS) protein, putative [Trypanosoma vivax Y486]